VNALAKGWSRARREWQRDSQTEGEAIGDDKGVSANMIPRI